MSGSLRLGLYLLAAVLVVYFGLKLIVGAIGFLMPFAIIAGIGLIIYGLVSRKALGGGRRILP